MPSAGIIERELEKEYEASPLDAERDLPAVQIDIPKERLELPEGASVFVKEIQIVGNSVLSDRDLGRVKAVYEGKDLSIKEVYELCDLLDQFYASKGFFLARTYPPPQEVRDGVLTIRVIEGCLGRISVEGNHYYSSSFILSYFAGLQGKPLCHKDFFRQLMLLNDNHDLIVGALFEKGKEFGCADVILRVKDERPIHLYLNGNNYGRNLTTTSRFGGRLDWGNLIFQGDQFSVAEVVGFPFDALYFTDAKYFVPLNRKGTSMEISYLFSRFHVKELTNLDPRGKSDIATLKFNQAVKRSRDLSLDAFIYFDVKQIQNSILSRRISFDKLRVLTFGALWDHYGWGGRDYLNMRMATGIPDFMHGLKSVDRRSSRVGGGGKFFKFNADYDRLQPLPANWFFSFHTSVQLSPSKLTVPEQIYIGGSDTVRGFPLAVAVGDSGYFCNLEMRFPLPFLAEKQFFNFNKKWKDVIQLDAFVDHGGVFLQSIKNTFLWGTGAGIRVYGPYSVTLSVDFGFPLNRSDLTNSFFYYLKLTSRPF
ncbi:MAG: POTRA domain-containing protein [Chlamydiales bacterium]